MRELPEDEQRDLGLHLLQDGEVLDNRVSDVWRSLKRRNVDPPSYLWPGARRGGSIYGYLNYHLTVPDVETLYVHGFYAVDVPDIYGFTPLLSVCDHRRDGLDWETVKWFLDKHADGRQSNLWTGHNALHRIAWKFHRQFYGRASSTWNDAIGRRLSDHCGPTCTDACHCFCSSYGCTPIHLALYVRSSNFNTCRCSWSSGMSIPGDIYVDHGGDGRALTWDVASLDTWLEHTGVTPMQREACYAETCRVEVFIRLGMAHTCCLRFRYGLWDLSNEERQEIRDDDLELKDALDSYLQLYKDLRREHYGSLSPFWDAWWRTMNVALPREKSKQRPSSRMPNVVEAAPETLGPLRDIFGSAVTEEQHIDSSGGSALFDPGVTWMHVGTAPLQPNRELFFKAMRNLLGYHNVEDPGDIFSDAVGIFSED